MKFVTFGGTHCPTVSLCKPGSARRPRVGFAVVGGRHPNVHGGGASAPDSVHAAWRAAPSATYPRVSAHARASRGSQERSAGSPPIRAAADQDHAIDLNALPAIRSMQYAIEHGRPRLQPEPRWPAAGSGSSLRVGRRRHRAGSAIARPRVGHDRQTPGADRRGECEPVEFVEVEAQHRGHRGQHGRAVERADQRQLPPRRIGEARDQARFVLWSTSPTALTTPEVPSDTTQSPGPAPMPSAAAALSPAPVRDRAPGGPTRRLVRAEDRRKFWVSAPHRKHQQVRVIFAALRCEVARAAGVAAVGGQLRDVGSAREPPGQPVVR